MNADILQAGAGADALRLGTSAAAWVCFEEGAARLGEDVAQFKEVLAGLGTSVVFSLACACSCSARVCRPAQNLLCRL